MYVCIITVTEWTTGVNELNEQYFITQLFPHLFIHYLFIYLLIWTFSNFQIAQ